MMSSDTSWSTLAAQEAKGEFYCSQAWLTLLSDVYGYDVLPLTATNTAGRITGFLPLCLVRSPLTGRRLVSLPFSDFCPLIATEPHTAHELIDQAIGLATQEKCRYLELRTGVNDVLENRSDLVESNLYVRWLTSLAADPDTVWTKIKKPVQTQVKKAQKLNVRVRFGQRRQDMEQYYRLHLRTRSKKHGMPAQPQRFFLQLWDAFAASGTLQLLLAEYEGNTIAGIVVFAAGTTVRYAYGGSDERYLHLAPNNLLMWTAISWACQQGYQAFDFGRTSCDNHGLMQFKRGWGSVKQPLPYYYYPRTAGLTATAEHSWKHGVATSCWKRLPLGVAEPVGGRLYKHLG